MDRQKYDAMILNRIESSLDALMPLGAGVAFLAALFVVLSGKAPRFVIYDSVLGLMLFSFFLFRHKIPVRVKITVIASTVVALGTLGTRYSGFAGVGPVLFAIGSVLAVSFLSTIIGCTFSGLTVLLYGIIPVLEHIGMIAFDERYTVLNDPVEWANHIVAYLLLVSLLNVVIDAIKRYLILNITEAEKKTAMISELAYRDALTGLPNRYGFIENMKGRTLLSGWLVLYEVKGLNLINSVHSVETGDRLLISIAQTMRTYAAEADLLARTGGNEFSWFLPVMEEEELWQQAELFSKRVALVTRDAGIPVDVRFYAGCVKIVNHVESVEASYRKASIALEQARQQNHSFLTPYDQRAEDAFKQEVAMRECLSDAILRREFRMHYQEKVDCVTHRVIGVEALARWNSGILGAVSPGAFIPIVENSGMAISFGRMIISEVMEQYALLKQQYGWEIPVSINISPTHLTSPDFLDQALSEAARCMVPTSSVQFELTEDMLIENAENVAKIVAGLRKLGFLISLDDFGTGYSSLRYLSLLELDELKIDRSFIHRLESDPKVAVLIRSIINLQEAYGFSIVAEGVETQEQCDSLLLLGCRNIQGYLFSKPVPLREVAVHADGLTLALQT